MQLNNEEITTPPRDAASVILLRDDQRDGLQVFLLRRNSASAVLGGAYVFPGGKVDDADEATELTSRLSRSADDLHPTLNEADLPSRRAAALYVAALREAFEECGVLLGQWEQQMPSIDHLSDAARRLNSGISLSLLLQEMQARLDDAAIVPWSRWITPKKAAVMTKRFDTRFFVAGIPEGQHAVHDSYETDESIWLSPHQALEQYYDNHIDLAPPQIMSLAHLAQHNTVSDVLAEARSKLPPLVEPMPVEGSGDARILCYPGDPEHSVSTRALPGPTRLQFQNKRFAPPGDTGDWWRRF